MTFRPFLERQNVIVSERLLNLYEGNSVFYSIFVGSREYGANPFPPGGVNNEISP